MNKNKLMILFALASGSLSFAAAAPKEGFQTRSYAGKIYEPRIGQAKTIYPEKGQTIEELPPELKNIILEYVGDFQVVDKIRTNTKIGAALGFGDPIKSILFLSNNKIAALSEGNFFWLNICDQIKQKCETIDATRRSLNKIIQLPNNRIAFLSEDVPFLGRLEKGIKTYNYVTKKYSRVPINIHVDAMAYLPENKFAVAGDQVLQIYDFAKSLMTSIAIAPGVLGPEEEYFRDLVALDKDHVVLAARDKVMVYNVHTGAIVKQIAVWGFNGSKFLIRVSASKFILITMGGGIWVWDINLDLPVKQWNAGAISAAALYDENTVITSSGYDLIFWDIRSGLEINKIISKDMIYSLAVSDTGDIAAGGADQIVLFRNLAKIFMDERKPKKK